MINIIKEKTFCAEVSFEDTDGSQVLLLKKFTLRETPKGRRILTKKTDAKEYKNKEEMVEDILKNSWTILKDEFWNQHKYRPVGFNKFKIQNYD